MDEVTGYPVLIDVMDIDCLQVFHISLNDKFRAGFSPIDPGESINSDGK